MRIPALLVVLVGLFACVTGCVEESADPVPGDGRQDTGVIDEVDSGAEGDGAVDTGPPRVWTVHVSPDAPEAVRWTAEDVTRYLQAMGLTARLLESTGTIDCEAGQGDVLLVGDGLGSAPEGLSDQGWAITETRCGGRKVELAGGGLLGRQYAGYDWLHRLGVRFFHPEQEHVPAAPAWPEAALEVSVEPRYRLRSVSLHLTHPLELGDAVRLKNPAYGDEIKRYIDWGIKNYASDGMGGVSDTPYAEYGLQRGFPSHAGFSLHNRQQGGGGIIDPDEVDPLGRIDEAVAERVDAECPDYFDFTFNPTEFTEIPAEDAVDQMNQVVRSVSERCPDTQVFTTNHGTAGEPVEPYGVRFYDLPKFADERLGVKVHTLMFYDLQRPAPVYGNENFNHLFDFMQETFRTRPLIYFPEAAWWLTFDIAVPLYLPITIEARSRDLEAIDFMRDGKLVGHRVFGTGHEWGYWQNEYCSYRMAALADYGWRECVADLTAPMGDAGETVRAVLEALITQQEQQFVYGDLLAYLVGTDPETEAAAAAGFVFHPLPPAPAEIGAWTQAEVDAWRARIETGLTRMVAQHDRLLEQLGAVEAEISGATLPWFAEIRDGVRANRLRALHQLRVYGALVLDREARLLAAETSEDADEVVALRMQSQTWFEEALAVTDEVRTLVRSRAESYRYQPVERAIGGGESLDGDDNWTTYPYRYLARTHHVFYYERIDRLVRAELERRPPLAELTDALLGPAEDLELSLRADADATVDVGEAGVDPISGETTVTHRYGAPGTYTVEVEAADEEPARFEVAVVSRELRSNGQARVIDPEVDLLAALLPQIALGPVSDAELVLGFRDGARRAVRSGSWVALPRLAEGLASAPTDVVLPLKLGAAELSIGVSGAAVAVNMAESAVRFTGSLDTDDVVDALLSVGGGAFENEEDARATIAQVFGTTVEDLPEQVPFEVLYPLTE